MPEEIRRQLPYQIDQLETTPRKMKKYQQADDLFAYAVVPGGMLLLLGSVLGNTRFRRLP